MNEKERRAIVAGIIMGEGGFYLEKNRSRGSITLAPRINITNADLALLHFCQSVIGGKIYQLKRKTPATYPIRKKIFDLVVMGQKNILTAIEKIIPYLVTLDDEARLLAEFCKRRLDNGGTRVPYSERDWEIYNKLRKRRD